VTENLTPGKFTTIPLPDAAKPPVVANAARGKPVPYILLRDGPEARLSRALLHKLVAFDTKLRVAGASSFGQGTIACSSVSANRDRIGSDGAPCETGYP
jgi:hypothetical protein